MLWIPLELVADALMSAEGNLGTTAMKRPSWPNFPFLNTGVGAGMWL